MIPEISTELRQRPAWRDFGFRRPGEISIRQALDARSYGPLLFEKAAQVILLLEIAARKRDVGPADVYANLRIEPAVCRIANFTRDTLKAAESRRQDILQVLQRDTGQARPIVFYDLADGKTVSFRLASATKNTLSRVVPNVPIGDVVLGTDRRYRRPSTQETIYGPSDPGETVDPNKPWPNR
jgi:hypothetical protein